MSAANVGRNQNGLDAAGEALRILVNEAAKIERDASMGARPYERSATRRDVAPGFKHKTMRPRFGELTFGSGAGRRRVLGCDIATSEAEINWRRFLEGLLARGLKGVRLIIADDHAGLKAPRRAVLPSVPWQRCQFHLQQNAGALTTRQEARKTVAEMMRAIFNAPDRTEAERLLKTALETWRKEHPKLAEWAETAIPESLTVFENTVSAQANLGKAEVKRA